MVNSTCCDGRDSRLSYLRQSWKSVNRGLVDGPLPARKYSYDRQCTAIGYIRFEKIVYTYLYSITVLYLRLCLTISTQWQFVRNRVPS